MRRENGITWIQSSWKTALWKCRNGTKCAHSHYIFQKVIVCFTSHQTLFKCWKTRVISNEFVEKNERHYIPHKSLHFPHPQFRLCRTSLMTEKYNTENQFLWIRMGSCTVEAIETFDFPTSLGAETDCVWKMNTHVKGQHKTYASQKAQVRPQNVN